MGYENEMKIEFDSRSCNEGFIRVAVSAFMTQLNPTLEEVADVKTAVSEAVTNCIVHAYDGKVEKITVSCHIEGNALCLSVKDTGCGIPYIEKAMEPLFTTRPEMERSGMGFAFMEAFMDEVHVESTPGHGTTVSMRKEIGWNKPLHGSNVLTRGTKMQGIYSHSRIWDLSIPSRGVLTAEDVRWKI